TLTPTSDHPNAPRNRLTIDYIGKPRPARNAPASKASQTLRRRLSGMSALASLSLIVAQTKGEAENRRIHQSPALASILPQSL
ncbi:hypothetical protein QWJ46_17480, partial [Rhizobium sp. CBN3]|uniref:hypothetical protein n=1 Tax=Rhizobium sp. CBN3 TaxID=3058045 RepID=UPI00267381B6